MFYGDKTGYIHIGYKQELFINDTNSDIPFNAHVYETAKATYPPRPFFYQTHLHTSGEIQGIEDLYVFDGGSVTIDTNGSIGMTTSARVSLKSLHVQDKGTFQMDSHTIDTIFVIDATNITIYGGGHFKCGTGLNMTTHHLLAIYSGGLIDLNGKGHSLDVDWNIGYGTGSTSGGSGAGHGGSGGRGAGMYSVGQGYDSLYTPVGYGNPGGYGRYKDSLYFGVNEHGNALVYGHTGGVGGGSIYIYSRHVDIDGHVTVNGENPGTALGADAGGGSGGSVWIYCDEVVGHGVITANGGNGTGQGGGGGGGRISIQSSNIYKLNITLKAYGGVSNFETGGAGTKYIELFNSSTGIAKTRELQVDNNGNKYPRAAIVSFGDRTNLLDGRYDDISQAGGITWLYHNDPNYKFNTVTLSGNAHVAILSNTSAEDIDIRIDYLYGDTTGVLHTGKRQTFGFTNVDTYMPINILSYRYSFLEIPQRITMREVWAEINGTIIGLQDISVENGGKLYIWSYANTEGSPEGTLELPNIAVKAGGKFEPLTTENNIVMKINVTTVTVNGNGYVRTNHLELHAVNVTIDLSGDFHADFTGHSGDIGPGAGLRQSHHVAASGGGHGGRGGRAYKGYYSALSYDSIYMPNEMGSGGGTGSNGEGGRGGGIIHMYISDELRVEGRLHSNGELGRGTTGGAGAGGSIYVVVGHLDGAGSFETFGGSGSKYGGGGGGGRIAIYHTGENHFTGEYLIHAGYGLSGYGASGTLYLEDQTNATTYYKHLTVDNGGYTTSDQIDEVEKLDLTKLSTDNDTWGFYTYNNVHFMTDISSSYDSYDYSYLGRLTDGSLTSSYYNPISALTITITLQHVLYVDHIRVFPTCSSEYRSNYAVKTMLDTNLIERTDGYIDTLGCDTQKNSTHYGKVIIQDYIDKIYIQLQRTHTYVALSELAIYISEDFTRNEQDVYSNSPGAAYIMHSIDKQDKYEFDLLTIKGGASLEMSSNAASLYVHETEGDNTGRVTVRVNQTMSTSLKKELLEFSVLTQRESELQLPPSITCREVDLLIKGHFETMENITVNAHCSLIIDHFEPTVNKIDHLDIKTFGEMKITTDREALTTIEGMTLTVRSGSLLFSNDLKLTFTNITIEPYGELIVDKGVPEREKETGIGRGYSSPTGCSGAGHGGNGGQGQGQAVVGAGHGSYLQPTTFGKNGGHSMFPHTGGQGGGRLELNVSHTLTVDGYLTAKGGDWQSYQSGGGSGGSIFIHTWTIDGDGILDASGGVGYDGSVAHHGGGGGGGRVTLYYTYDFYVGTFKSAGGEGGSNAEDGGPGTIYVHLLPINPDDLSSFVSNRTLFIDNHDRSPKDPFRNLTQFYSNYSMGSGVAWMIPADYPDFVVESKESKDMIFEEIQIYRSAVIAMVKPDDTTFRIDLRVAVIDGDKSGHIQIGYNQSFYIESGQLPNHLSIYRGGEVTLQGELRVAGVDVMIEGNMKNVENLTVVEKGTLKINQMTDTSFNIQDEIVFIALNIRNLGSMYMNNGMRKHILTGNYLQVYPGGLLNAKNLQINAETVVVDVLGEVRADNNGYCDGGPGEGFTIEHINCTYGTGGSYGGEGGSEDSTHDPPLSAGQFNRPNNFGSNGAKGSNYGHLYAGGCGGGIIYFNITKEVKIDGVTSSSGQDGANTGYAGGGTGGSILIETALFDGSGSIEIIGGSGRSGGSGGRLSIIYSSYAYIGELMSLGGSANGGETGAAGTVYLRKIGSSPETKLLVYNQKGKGNRKTRITIPEATTSEHDLDTLDLGTYANVGMMAIDNEGLPSSGYRKLTLTKVAGDHTAGVHVEADMWLNIDFDSTAVLSFDVSLYENGTVNLPFDTYLRDCRISLYGGTVQGLQTLNISLDGAFYVYPKEKANEDDVMLPNKFELNSITVLDGGLFEYYGEAVNDNKLDIKLNGSLIINGGGEFRANNMYLEATNITIDAEGLLTAAGQGWEQGKGLAPGINSTDGGSGGSHGGLGGTGSGETSASVAYGNVRLPTEYGSGGPEDGEGTGGGIIYLKTLQNMEIDGDISVDGNQSKSGGGSGGSIILQSPHFTGTGKISSKGGDSNCVAHCSSCNKKYRCLECESGYFLVSDNCVSSCVLQANQCCYQGGTSLQCNVVDTSNCYRGYCKNETSSKPLVIGGGGGGGRIAVISTDSYTYRGTYYTYGGTSFKESGGSGTVFVQAPHSTTGVIETSVYVDNNGITPDNGFIDDKSLDTCRTYIVTTATDTMSTLSFDHLHINGGGHIAFRNTSDNSPKITIGYLHGDKSGMLHVTKEQSVTVEDNETPFPTSFRIYEEAEFNMPQIVTLSGLEYKTIYIDGVLTGANDLTIGQGVDFLIGENSHTVGESDRQFTFDTLEIQADGTVSSTYVDEFVPSLILTLNTLLRIHAGGKIKAPYVDITAKRVQIDVAGVINATGAAPSSLEYQDAQQKPDGGGSGGGNGGAGGQGKFQPVVGVPPNYGSLYTPKEYGGNGGKGGGASTAADWQCSPHGAYNGGSGGGVVVLSITDDLSLDGEIICDGTSGDSERAGGGAGGSIFVKANTVSGTGSMSVRGGDIIGNTTCLGGGGAGGRIALHYDTYSYSGKLKANGGTGFECGGAGTVLFRDTSSSSDTLQVDNNNVCSPIDPSIDFDELSDIGRRKYSCVTWIYDKDDCTGSCSHSFAEVIMNGLSHIAVHRQKTDTHQQFVTVYKTSGDKTGTFHVGNLQKMTADLPEDSPELQFGLIIYTGGQMGTAQTFVINDITVALEGTVTGAENLIIGPGGKFLLKPYGNDSSADLITDFSFSTVTVQGGGTLEIDSIGNSMKLIGTELIIESGGVLIADFVDIEVNKLIVDQSGKIHANGKAGSNGNGVGYTDDGSGAGHGGMGGTGSSAYAGGYFYGNVKTPRHFGSNSKSDDKVAYGGGIISVVATTSAEVNGIISCNGQDGGSGSGGASGGAIKLQTGTLSGSGKIQTNGGKGTSSTGGGAGGRVAVYYTSSEYTGEFTAYGGQSSAGYGGAGTVYVDTGSKTKIIVDNREAHTVQKFSVNLDLATIKSNESSRTWITFVGGNSIEIDELQLLNGAHMALEPSSSSSTINKLLALSFSGNDDFVKKPSKIGTLLVGANQEITIRQVSLYFPAHAKVYQEGTLTLPSTVRCFSTVNYIDGTLGGLQDLTLYKTTITFSKTSQTHTTSSSYQMQNLNIKQNSTIYLTDIDVEFTMNLNKLMIGASGEINAKKLTITATEVETEEGGTINLDKLGGEAADNNDYSGAGHGGEGGTKAANFSLIDSFDHFLQPTLPGKGGHATQGGGVLKITVTTLNHKGAFNARGENATENSGGASGGSIWVTADSATITGSINVNGGNGKYGGGGGGGLIAVVFTSGNIYGDLISYGGSGHGGGMAGGAGSVYLGEDINGASPNRKVIIKNIHTTDTMTRLPVPTSESTAQVEIIDIKTATRVSFSKRESVGQSLSATVGTITTDTKSSNFTVDSYTELFLSTKFPYSLTKLNLRANVYVNSYAKIELPATVYVEKDYVLELCGTILSKTSVLTVRDGGIFKIGAPANTGTSYVDSSTTSKITLSSLVIDYNGKVEHTKICIRPTQKVQLQLTNLNTSGDYSIDTSFITLKAGYNNNQMSLKEESICTETMDVYIYRGSSCEFGTGVHNLTSITIEAGGTLNIKGDTDRNVTKILANSINVLYGGLITGEGKGYASGGPGAATSSSGGASHGGSGKNNPGKIYGNIVYPRMYGSNGYGSTAGGGQIEFSVANTFTLNGEVNMNGKSASSGGSGGSILIQTKTLTGTGKLSAIGGSGGGGGGRISIITSSSYDFDDGVISVESTGGTGSPGTVYLSKSGTKVLMLDHDGSTELTSGLSLPSTLDELMVKSNASLSLETDLTVAKLSSDGTGKVTITNNARMTISAFDDINHGCQCDFVVDEGSTLEVTSDFDLTGTNPSLDLKGTLTVSAFSVWDHGSVTVHPSGTLGATSLELQEFTQMDLKSGATYNGIQSLTLGYDSKLTLNEDSIALSLTKFHMKIKSEIELKTDSKSFSLVTTECIIEDEAVLSVSSGGSTTGSGAGNSEKGASYGGEGGSNTGTTYGSTTSPSDAGSGCGTVRGGGIISIQSTSLSIDGTISADGGDGTTTGAGSGGSIKITGDSLEGHGTISVNGGTSDNQGGGGGGRMSLNVKAMSSFYGFLTAYGGKGGTKNGGAGTVYKVSDLSGGASKTELNIDNNHLTTDSQTVINGITTVSEIGLNGKAKTIFDSSGGANIEIKLVTGDHTGLLTVQASQYFVIATSYGTQYAFSLPCKILIEENGYATVPARLQLEDDTNDEEVNLEINGNVIALRNLVVASNGRVSISSTARSGLTTSGLTDAGIFSLSNLDVTTDGLLEISKDSTIRYTIKVLDVLNVKYGGEINARNLYIEAPTLQVANNGLINVDGGSSDPGSGVGTDGSGASHGGSGGASSSGSEPTANYVGSVFTATNFGSAGGDTTSGGKGGSGGGITKLKITTKLTLNGLISSHGNNGEGDGGGGSGGSIYIDTVDIVGAGSLSVIGGNATTGGGGGGGRVYLDATGDYNFTGKYVLKGGNSNKSEAGGAGTADQNYLMSNLAFHKLLSDNAGIKGDSISETIIDLPGQTKVTVNELEVGDSTKISITTVNLHFIAEELVCGSASILVINDNTIFSADVSSDYSKLTCSLHLQQLGETRLPKKVELLGSDNQFKGTLTNIQNLIIASGQQATFSAETRTATYKEGVFNVQEAGAYKFANFTIKDYATVTFETTGKALQLTILELHYGSTLKGKKILLQSNGITLQPGSTIDLSGGGYAAQQGSGKGSRVNGMDLATGAGHGSPGGASSTTYTGGDVYDLTRNPTEAGSGGGSSASGTGGHGGGYLKIDTFYDITNNGIISVDGSDATGEGAGGGSGGTIVITTRNILGEGTISVNGGKGSGKGGGGSGGRMKLKLQENLVFGDKITAYGGGNDDTLNTVKAGAGTIYIQDGTGINLLNRLWVIGDTDESGLDQTQTFISGETADDFHYDIISLKGYSHSDIEGDTTTFILDQIDGDNTAWIFVKKQQILKAEVVEGVLSNFVTNININLGEQATLHVPTNMTVSACTVDLSGMVTFNNLIVEGGGKVILNPTSMTASYTDSGYDISDSVAGVYTLNYLALKSGSTFSPSVGLQLVAVNVDIKRNIVMYADFADLKVGTLTMERGAEINVGDRGLTNGVPSTAHGSDLNGGAYASEGGVGGNSALEDAAVPYGTIYNPLLPGSSGGNGSKGAGYISIQADVFTLNGNLRANGGSSTTGGGGSGGSIFVKCISTFKGFGVIESNGGDTTNSLAGGGSGGRIAVYNEEDIFSEEGTYRAKGGASPAINGNGGPGSIYTSVGSGKNLVESLTVDNENQQLNFYLTLNEANYDLTFDLLNAKTYAKVQMTEDVHQRTLNVKRVSGDGTGLIRMRQNQTGTLERFSADALISKLEVNLELYNGGEFILTETTTILGKASTALDLDGIMTGVVNLILGPQRHMRMGSNAKIVPSASAGTTQARVSFGFLQLDPGSTLDFDENTGAEMFVGTLNVKYMASITGDYFDITCTTLDIELEAKMSAASIDRTNSDSIDTNLGKAVEDGFGGAGHSGMGGGTVTSSGDSYGSIYAPAYAGSRPRDQGGKGGGKIHINAGYKVYNDGEVSVNGSASVYGGGSGGSIWIETYSFDGYGTYTACGGDSSGVYGAGSAGRIAVISKTEMTFTGTYPAFGGTADTPNNTAAAGTVYLEDVRKDVAYRRLMLDNAGRFVEKYSTIEEVSQTEFYFDELHLMNQATLHVRDAGISIFVDIRLLAGDRSGLLHIHKNQRYIAEYEAGIRQAFTSGINAIVDEEGEIIFPSIMYIYGVGIRMTNYPETRSVQIYGRITGVANLILGFETLVYIGQNGHTAMLGEGSYTDKGRTYLYKDDNGQSTFGSVDLRALSSIKYAPDIPMLSNVGRIDCRYKTVISAESIYVNTSTLNVEAGSEVTTSATDRPLDTIDEETGSGRYGNTSSIGTGGGHGSEGGVYDQTEKTVIVAGGDYHGSLYTPLKRGSAGGAGPNKMAGKGGGIIELNVATALYVDGEITADGSNGDSSSGGGSGGSIFIKSTI